MNGDLLSKILFNNKDNFRNIIPFHYYSGNNKLIIEYTNKIKNDAILIINPLEENSQKTIFYFKIYNYNHDKLYFYQNILKKDKINLNTFKNSNVVISFQEFNFFIVNLFNSLISEINAFEKEVLAILIALFYYEKYLNNNEYTLDENNKYFLINPIWFKHFKEIYNYSCVNQILNNYNKKISFDTYEQSIENIIDLFFKNQN